MSKKLIIPVLLSILLFNCVSVPVFADTTPSTNTMNYLSAKQFEEPHRGVVSYREDMSSSFYIWHKVTATYVYHKDENIWYTQFWNIWDTDEGNTLLEVNKIEPYPIDMLPQSGTDGEQIVRTWWEYMGDGIKPEIVLRRLNELECKINTSNKQNI